MRRAAAIILALGLAVGTAACAGHSYPPPGGSASYPAVVLFGDSLLAQAVPWIRASFSWYGVDAPVIDRATNGIGVLDLAIGDLTTEALDLAPEGSLVVIQFSGNCFSGPGGCPHVPGTDAFYTAWREGLTQIVNDVRARNMVPLLVVHPKFGPAVGEHANTAGWVGVVTMIVANDTGTPMIRWGDALHDIYDQYQALLWYADVFAEPAWHAVRLSDGVHFADDGTRRAAAWLAHGISNLEP